MKKIVLFLLALLLILSSFAFAEDGPAFLGQPFPDFTVTDIDGNIFTLSEALKNYEAVVINFWATWCGPCLSEFPEVNKVYEAYKDRVAFIALSTEANDTNETITDYRRANGLTLPMGRDENQTMFSYTQSEGIPTTVIVDRYGNAGFCQVGIFRYADDLIRTLDTFLGDQYSETVVQHSVPADTSTVMLPVSSVRAIYLDNPEKQKALVHLEGYSDPMLVYILNDSVAHVRVEQSVADAAANVCFYDGNAGYIALKDIYNPELGTLVHDVAIPETENGFSYGYIALFDYDKVYTEEGDPDLIEYYLVRSAEDIDAFMQMLNAYGYSVSDWETVEEDTSETDSVEAYIIHVIDQNGNPVPEVFVNFCTDTACVPCETDITGSVSFSGEPDTYHVQFIAVPDGYSYDESFEIYTPKAHGEWTLRIRKD